MRSRIHLIAVANPFDIRRDVVGRVHGLAEDSKAAGIDHSDCNVLAVRKRNHRVLDAQFVTQLGMQWIAHPGSLLSISGIREA